MFLHALSLKRFAEALIDGNISQSGNVNTTTIITRSNTHNVRRPAVTFWSLARTEAARIIITIVVVIFLVLTELCPIIKFIAVMKNGNNIFVRKIIVGLMLMEEDNSSN